MGASVAGRERDAAMAVSHRAVVDHTMQRQRHDRFRAAGPERTRGRERTDQLRRDRAGRESRIDLERSVGTQPRDILDEMPFQEGAKILEPLMKERHAGRHSVPPALHQQTLGDGEPHRGPEIGTGDRAAGAGPAALRKRDGKGRAIEALAQPRSHEADDPGMPAFHGGHDDGPAVVESEKRQSLGLRLLDGRPFDHLPLPVEPVEVGRDPGRIDGIAREQQARAQHRSADPSSGIDARPDQEPEMERRGRPFGARDVEQRREAGPPPARHDGETLRHEGAIEPDQRHHIRHRGQGHEVERLEEVRCRPAGPEPLLLQGSLQPDQHHEDDACGAERSEAREVVVTVGIDQRHGVRQLGAELVVVDHHGAEPEATRFRERNEACRSAVDRDQQGRAARCKVADRLQTRPVAVDHAVGDVDRGVEPRGPQIFHHQGRGGSAVDVVVAQNRDLLPDSDGPRQMLHGGSHVAQRVGIRHEAPQGGIEIGDA